MFIKKAAAALLSAAMLLTPASSWLMTAHAGEQLGQNDFDDGVGLPWHLCESEPAEMDFEIDGGVYRITIINPGGASRGGEDRWDCQFRHRGLKIVSGHQYRVRYEITSSNSGKYYTKIGNLEGDVEIWHNMSTGSGDFDSTWDPIQINANETKKVDLTFTASQSLDVAEWAFHLGGDGEYTPGGCFPEGTVITFDNMSLEDLSGSENDYQPPEEYVRSGIMTNQLGYFPESRKQATLLSDEGKGIAFSVKNADSGEEAFSGTSKPFGTDRDSGDKVHTLDFTELDEPGSYYIEAENGEKSKTFSIGVSDVYSAMLYDSLNYFYQSRSAIDIESKYITSGDADALARSAGHVSDNATIQQTWGYSGSSGTQDVAGGWYDAGDHGKYVVNGGISLWLMQNQYETALAHGYEKAFADGSMNIPENSNGYPDLLDEARWEMEWMFTMLVADGDYKDMAYHKVHDEKWTALALPPAEDDMNRVLKPPTTAATLNVSACAAQAARLWKGIDDDFAEECLDIAKRTFAAAEKHPDMYAPLDESIGGGAYGDTNAEDEFYWAECELFLTTGDEEYLDKMKSSEYCFEMPTTIGGGEHVDTIGSFDWGNTAALGTLSLAVREDTPLSSDDYEKASDNIVKAADHYLQLESSQGYGLPYGQSVIGYDDSDTGYVWGSNSVVADNSIVLAYAMNITGDRKYFDGAVSGMDYLLGRNAMDQSYVTGYGEHSSQNPHHRWWSNQVDATFPKAPCGVLTGGPNSGMQDPWVKGSGWKKGEIAPQKCYLDHVEAWSVNECTINWNTPLAWLTAFLLENGSDDGIVIGATGNGTGIDQSAPDTSGDKDKEDNGDTDKNSGGADNDKNNADNDKSDKTDKDDEDSGKSSSKTEKSGKDEDGGSKNSTIILIIVIALCVVIALISVEVFLFKMAKLKNQQNIPQKENKEENGGDTRSEDK